jgi:tetratricopeptide (TPR) repeat protein
MATGMALQSKRRMFRFLLVMMLAAPAFAGDALYELSGRLVGEGRALVLVFGASAPFEAETESDDNGRFRFRNLRAGAYTIAVIISGRGEARQTAEIGPGTADSSRRVFLTLQFKESDFVFNDMVRRRNSVSTKQLAIPEKAMREYQEARKDLEKHDVESAVKRLEHAVELAPQFADAWNNLGTIAYQTEQYDRAERCFRAALQQDPQAFEPLVNLGGVLINTHKLDEALMYNQDAVLTRPNDALANSQLGLAYFVVDNFDLAVKYLETARRIDPAHFSHPQLVLAEIHLRRGENGAAADALADFLQHHPDFPTADKIRENIAKLRN